MCSFLRRTLLAESMAPGKVCDSTSLRRRGGEGSAQGGSMLEVREEARVAAAVTRQGAGVSQVGDGLGLVVTRHSFSF